MLKMVANGALALVCSAALLIVLPATAGLAKAGKGVGPFVTGSGTVMLTASSPAPFSSKPFSAGDRLHVSMTARTFPHGWACSAQRSCGQFLIVDHMARGTLVFRLKGSVTCASFKGHEANVTGIVKSGRATPRTMTVRGQTVAISVNDDAGPHSADLLGLSSAVFGGAAVDSHTCAGTPTNLTVSQGEFVVHNTA